MKRMIIATGLLALLAVAVVANSFYITGTIGQMIDSIKKLPDNAEAFGDGSSAIAIVDDIDNRWENAHAIMDLSLQVAESRAVCLLIADLRVYAETGDFTKFHSAAEQLEILLEHLYESEEFSLGSIL